MTSCKNYSIIDNGVIQIFKMTSIASGKDSVEVKVDFDTSEEVEKEDPPSR